MVERPLMMTWVIGLITHGGSIDLFLVQPMLHDLCNKGCGICSPVFGMVHIKEPLQLISKNRT